MRETMAEDDYLTVIPGVPSKASVAPGMAHFAGTGPPGEHCSDCEFRGYYRVRNEDDDEKRRTYLYGGCEKFRKLTGRHGPVIRGSNRACKYFKESISKRMESEMDIDQYITDGGFIKVDTLAGGNVRDVIADCRPGRYEKPDLHLQGGGVLGLNATNLRTLRNAWGPQSDDWVGKEIELYVGQTTYNNETRDSVLIRTISPPTEWRKHQAAQMPRQPRQKELDDEIPF